MPNTFYPAVPVLYVRNLRFSINYYVQVLGFKLDWEGPGSVVGISRDRCSLMLAEGDQGHAGSWVWVGVEDAQQVYDDYVGKGAKIRHPPTNYRWAFEMQVEDPDGNVLRIGSEPKRGEPYGPWLDMRGDTWRMKPEGGWEKENRSAEH